MENGLFFLLQSFDTMKTNLEEVRARLEEIELEADYFITRCIIDLLDLPDQ